MQAQSQTMNNRVLVVSGGGCRGAWGAGLANKLRDEYGVYNVAFGTSTGSLMIPLILLDNFERLKNAYTTVTPEKIFDVNPFNKKGNFSFLNALVRIIFSKPTLGETNSLRNELETFLTDDDYEKIKAQKKLFAVGVVNLKNGERETKYSSPVAFDTETYSAHEIKDWIWASCNQPFLMTYYPSKKHPNPKAHGFYVDGGLRETVPLSDALKYALTDERVTNIDVIVNEPMYPVFNEKEDPTTLLKSLKRTTDIWRAEVIDNDVLLATQDTHCEGPTIHISLHYFPSDMYPANANDLVFDSTRMNKMWEAGYNKREDSSGMGLRVTEIDVCRRKVKDYFDSLKRYKDEFRKFYSH